MTATNTSAPSRVFIRVLRSVHPRHATNRLRAGCGNLVDSPMRFSQCSENQGGGGAMFTHSIRGVYEPAAHARFDPSPVPSSHSDQLGASCTILPPTIVMRDTISAIFGSST